MGRVLLLIGVLAVGPALAGCTGGNGGATAPPQTTSNEPTNGSGNHDMSNEATGQSTTTQGGMGTGGTASESKGSGTKGGNGGNGSK